ncbi:hypothetical protein G6O69_27305 [Pseudenhygromyxa sp. WMMC2535]|uniref:hypothetical protein n=1 Tax=Pseudenhygromyxa sp. WMMC2535 TaxID=2712867 RepID=UPI001554DBB4|nr:hypothetical protein [Pseudenhygromyxa sp. WMMC2535]NVB41577.1 hypothetical protein [Pseudenhygromyxa sp. WMMC2535]
MNETMWNIDAGARERLERAEQAMWATVARFGPTPRLQRAMLSALDGQPLRGQGRASKTLYDLVRELIDSGIDEQVVRYVVLDSFRIAGVIWEAYQDGYRAGVESVTPRQEWA